VVLSSAAAYGLCMACGVIFTPLSALLVFLLFGVGLDDMFVVTAGLGQVRATAEREAATRSGREAGGGKPYDANVADVTTAPMRYKTAASTLDEEELMATTLRTHGASICVTTATNAAAFGAGAISPVPAVRALCVYAAVAVSVDLLLQLSGYLSLLVWMERRSMQKAGARAEESLLAMNREDPAGDEAAVTTSPPLVAAAADSTRPPRGSEVSYAHDAIRFYLETVHAPVIRSRLGRALVLLIGATLVALGIAGGFLRLEGIRLSSLVLDGSSARAFLDLWETGPYAERADNVYLYLLGDQNLSSDPSSGPCVLGSEAGQAAWQATLARAAASDAFAGARPVELRTADGVLARLYSRLEATDAAAGWVDDGAAGSFGPSFDVEPDPFDPSDDVPSLYRVARPAALALALEQALESPDESEQSRLELRGLLAPAPRGSSRGLSSSGGGLAIAVARTGVAFHLGPAPEDAPQTARRVRSFLEREDNLRRAGPAPGARCAGPADVDAIPAAFERGYPLGPGASTGGLGVPDIDPGQRVFLVTSPDSRLLAADGESRLFRDGLMAMGCSLLACATAVALVLVDVGSAALCLAGVTATVLPPWAALRASGGAVNTQTAINFVVALGLGVDYSLHYLAALGRQRRVGVGASDKDESGSDRAVKALSEAGPLVVMGGGTSALAMIPLAFSASVVFRNFFIVLFTTVMAGLYSGTLLVPCLAATTGWGGAREAVKLEREQEVGDA